MTKIPKHVLNFLIKGQKFMLQSYVKHSSMYYETGLKSSIINAQISHI